MAAQRDRYRQSVFINCPFDNQYWWLFEALVFTVAFGVYATKSNRATILLHRRIERKIESLREL